MGIFIQSRKLASKSKPTTKRAFSVKVIHMTHKKLVYLGAEEAYPDDLILDWNVRG